MDIQLLDSKTFNTFGNILTMNYVPEVDEQKEFDFHDTVRNIELASHCCTGILACRNREKKVVKMERHHETSEIIAALDGDMILVTAPADDDLKDNSRVQAFMIKQGQSVAMKPNTWHWVPFPIGKNDVHALILFRDETGKNDLHFRELNEPIVLD
jgi:ureidoglycolate hydrolase